MATSSCSDGCIHNQACLFFILTRQANEPMLRCSPPPASKPPDHNTKWCAYAGNCGFLSFSGAYYLIYHLVARARTSLWMDAHERYLVPKGRGVKGTWNATSAQSRALGRTDRIYDPMQVARFVQLSMCLVDWVSFFFFLFPTVDQVQHAREGGWVGSVGLPTSL